MNLPTSEILPERRPSSVPPRRRPPQRVTRRRGRRWAKALGITLAVLLVIAVAGILAGYRYASSLLEGRGKQVAGTERPPPGEPTNILIVGSDSREGLSKKELKHLQTIEVEGQRTDTMIVLHVSPKRQKAVMVSLPRDLRTQVNGGEAKINAAGAGGPDLLVKTVEETTGLNINHFVEINFAGFLKVVDAVGGVTLCNHTDETIVDRYAGLRMKPGCHKVNGDKALAFVRARHIGGDGDFGRIQRQQEFMRAVMAKIASGGNLINLPKLIKIANAVSKVVETDDGLTAGEALQLARRVGNLSPEHVDMRLYPSVAPGPACSGCPDYVLPKPEAPILMKAIREDAEVLPPVGNPGGKGDVSLSTVRLTVLNGSGIPGSARRAAEELDSIGIPATVGGNADGPKRSSSVLSYPKRLADEAQLLEYLLAGQVQLVKADPDGPSNRLVLTVGSSYRGVGT